MALTDEQKLFAVQRFACFYKNTEVLRQLREEFGDAVPATLTRADLSVYNPQSQAGQRLGAELKKVFADTRARFLADKQAIPIANKNVRLRILDDIAHHPKAALNFDLQARIVEIAEKIEGGMFRKDSGPTPEEMAAYTDALVGDFLTDAARHVDDKTKLAAIASDLKKRLEASRDERGE